MPSGVCRYLAKTEGESWPNGTDPLFMSAEGCTAGERDRVKDPRSRCERLGLLRPELELLF